MGRRKGNHTKHRGDIDGRSQAWRAMDVLRTFTVVDLQVVTDGAIKIDNARAFLRRLAKYGYVRKTRDYKPHRPGCHAVWQIVKWTGPKSPIAMEDGRLYDPNLDKVFGEPHEHAG